MQRIYLDYNASTPVAPEVNPETNFQEREKLRMLVPNLDCRMALAHDSFVGIVAKRDCLGKPDDVFVAQSK